jgi:hypothetical protein
MGRNKKYLTDEERRLAKNAQRMKFYEKNKEIEKKNALQRYYGNKKM